MLIAHESPYWTTVYTCRSTDAFQLKDWHQQSQQANGNGCPLNSRRDKASCIEQQFFQVCQGNPNDLHH